MRMLKMSVTALLLGVFMTGCVDLTIGAPIDADQIKLVREGLTTTDDVQGYFGAPLHKTKTATGEIWVYRYVSDDLSTIQDLMVSFGEDSTVCVVNRDGI
ncbi:MAG: hypothetical protein JKY65_07340 [Planctomycetes bacterium]|nr:hypothetical protein [Planctomycetota bacterium]